MSVRKMMLGVAVTVLATAGASMAASINYADDCNSYPEWASIPTTPSAESAYWYTDVAGNYLTSDDWASSMRLWNVASGMQNANVFRNFRTAGELASDESVGAATVSALMYHGAGGDADPTLFSRIWLLNADGNGYMARVTRPGTMEIVKVTSGVQTQIAYDYDIEWGGDVPDGNAKVMSLSADAGVVTLSFYYAGAPGTVYSLSAGDTTYGSFTTIGMGGYYGWGETHTIDDVTFVGTIVPEPATLSLLSLAGVALMRRARR
jgi:hypothetical protein